MQNQLRKKFANNLTYAFTAQVISFVCSVIMSLIVPKLLGIEQFSYWQLFIFYTTYVGLFHFGLSDGIYLRYGGIKTEELDRPLIGSQFRVMFSFHALLAIAIIVVAPKICADANRAWVWIFAAIYIIVGNAFWYLGFVFQAMNETKIYSIGTIISRASFIVFIVLLIFRKTDNFKPFAFLYTFAMALAVIYIFIKGKDIVFCKQLPLKDVLSQMFENAKIGINLTVSAIASSLILGIGRIFVDASIGLESFGLVSFAISLTNFFLQFISQVSMVLFPMLRRFEKKEAISFYAKLSCGLSLALCSIYVVFVPLRTILQLWLPQYTESFSYLAILLPICLFDGKMQMLYNTYLKVFRKEKALLSINALMFVLSAGLCAIAAFVFGNVRTVAIMMVIVIAIRSVVTNIYLARVMGISGEKRLYWELAISLIFVLSNVYFNDGFVFLTSVISVGIYYFAFKDDLKSLIHSIKVRTY